MRKDKLLEEAISELSEAKQVRFKKILKLCENFFGDYRISGSHHIFKTLWQGDPRINLQKGKGNKAKSYQVRQVLRALRKLEELEKDKKDE